MAKRIRLLSRKTPPCGPADIDGAWRRLEGWFEEHFPQALDELSNGATTKEIRAFEKAIGRPLPEEVRRSFQIHNGLPGGIFSGMDYLSLDGALRQWSFWQERFQVDEFVREIDDSYRQQGTSFPEGAVCPGYVNPGWVPLAEDAVMNHLGVDLAPGLEGVPGQVINFGRDEHKKFVLAWTWGWFLTDAADELERGNFRLVEGYGLSLRDPPVDHFLDALEIWSKAKSGGRRPLVNCAIDPSWLSWNNGTVARLARSISEERAFDRLPILADALEDSGCDNAELLDHFRGNGVHVRGCWALDAVMAQT
jgi:cell wall assembly regulator SMI1